MPGAQARRGWGVLRLQRPWGAVASGGSRAITAASGFPSQEPEASGAILPLTTNFSGGRRRQRCRALGLRKPRWHRLGARGRRQLCVADRSARSAQARPRGEVHGAGSR